MSRLKTDKPKGRAFWGARLFRPSAGPRASRAGAKTSGRKDKLILHIGAHKSGTSTVQGGLYENRDMLAQRGIGYPVFPGKRQINRVVGMKGGADKVFPKGFVLFRPDVLREIIDACPERDILASGENISYMFDRDEISKLADLLYERFSSVTILTYLRRQDAHAVSHFQETAKPRRRQAEAALYGGGTTALPQTGAVAAPYLDYNQRIGLWMDVFGDENVIVRPFEHDRLKDGDLWVDFLDIVGLDQAGLRRPASINQSMGRTKTTIGHMMVDRDFASEWCDEILDRLPDDEKVLPSRAEAEAYYAPYRESNIALNARLGATDGSDLFSDDFSMYPERPETAWSKESVETALGLLLDEIKAAKSRDLSSTLRAAAEVLPDSDDTKQLRAMLAEAIARYASDGS